MLDRITPALRKEGGGRRGKFNQKESKEEINETGAPIGNGQSGTAEQFPSHRHQSEGVRDFTPQGPEQGPRSGHARDRGISSFQPLLYQVATGILDPAKSPHRFRHILRKQKNALSFSGSGRFRPGKPARHPCRRVPSTTTR